MSQRTDPGKIERAYAAVVNHWRDHQSSPSIREIGEAIGIASTSDVRHLLSLLEDQGLIYHLHNKKSRQITPTNMKITFEDEP